MRTSSKLFAVSSGKMSETSDSLSEWDTWSVSDTVDSLLIVCIVTPPKSTLRFGLGASASFLNELGIVGVHPSGIPYLVWIVKLLNST